MEELYCAMSRSDLLKAISGDTTSTSTTLQSLSDAYAVISDRLAVYILGDANAAPVMPAVNDLDMGLEMLSLMIYAQSKRTGSNITAPPNTKLLDLAKSY